jgi:3-phenylpropionate/trans-cinnamate dioxygenase ferredoxin reductase subunit
MNVNIWDASDTIQALVRAAKPVDASRLADPRVPPEDLLHNSTAG